MKRIALFAFATIATIVTVAARAQDAVQTLPDSYKLEFENEWVKIVRVHYEVRAKLPPHTHTHWATAYVYLNDSGPVVFSHIGLDYGAVTRPPTKAGSFRLFRGLEEIHAVENLSPLPSDFLRVEFKTDPVAPRTLRGKFFRELPTAGENLERVQFENAQVRITRLVVAPTRAIEVAAPEAEPSLLVSLTAAKFDGLTLRAGQGHWLAAGQRQRLANADAAPAEMLRFALKTRPLPAPPKQP